jgi:hypothetical protein
MDKVPLISGTYSAHLLFHYFVFRQLLFSNISLHCNVVTKKRRRSDL